MMDEVPRHNPSSGTEWIDDRGRVWHRRGGKRQPLDGRRVRTLVASGEALMATWHSFDVEWFDEPDTKRAALDRLLRDVDGEDLRYTEWQSESAGRLLIVEHFC